MFVQERDDGGQRLVTSASDLTAASTCEFAFLRKVDQKLGRDTVVPDNDDAMLLRAAELGDVHEARTLERYRAALGAGEPFAAGGVVEIPRPESMGEADLRAVADQTLVALRSGAEVVFQATFFEASMRPADPATGDPEIAFVGFADFLARRPDGSYEVQDTKLARRTKVTALMQLAAYAGQLERVGVPVSPEIVLILGDGARSRHRLADVAAVFRSRRERLHEILLERTRATGSDGSREGADPIEWGAPGIEVCGRCEVCEPEVLRSRDPLMIAGIRRVQRDRLIDAGLTTIDAVAQSAPRKILPVESRASRAAPASESAVSPSDIEKPPIDGFSQPVLERLALQAQVQLAAVPGDAPPVQVADAEALAAIPEPDPGDLFFDFEGDPMYREPGADDTARWGLDYLFGMVDSSESFTALWAHDLDAERRALEKFLNLVAERRRAHPGMKIYHYAAYERTHLLSIAARHGVREAEVDRLLREHVLVDLYPVVRRALRIGSRSYSIKRVEPLYMGDELRDEDGVTDGAASVVAYAEASAQLSSDVASERAAGQARLEAIADYNRYDCVSTLRLRDWLLGIAAEHGVEPHVAHSAEDESGEPELELSAVGAALASHAEAAGNTRDRAAAALGGSAIDYYQREQKSFWWAHYARLTDPLEEWSDTRDVFVVDRSRSRVDGKGWHRPPRARAEHRYLELHGEFAPGSTVREGSQMYALYEYPAPFIQPGAAPGARGAKLVRVREVHESRVVLDETLPKGAEEWTELPFVLAPGPPPNTTALKGAIVEWGEKLVAALEKGGFPADPVVDLMRRIPPRLHGGGSPVEPESAEALAAGGGDEETRAIGAVTASLRLLSRSVLAVQGPPGTGKTYLAAHVIKRLVEEDGWHIGVVAQSHRVVENVLEGVVSAGLSPGQVGKVPAGGKPAAEAPQPGYTALPRNGQARFMEEQRERGRGSVTAGTAWDFSNEARYPRGSLDLLVVDEAGQFSLAPTIASAAAAERLLLLGDPQQLPQVSQGTHPEPVDTSALGWLLGPHETMPGGSGYFLAETRRMRPELADVVSELAYEGRLHAHSSASLREVTEAGPAGLVWHPVSHHGNSTSSPEEAAEVVRVARDALRGRLSDAGEPPRALTEDDLMVVAAYNAQVECVAAALADAGLDEIRVGTVDRFQGQEAVIAIVTLAASSAEDVPRGLEFLLMRNRLNVAVSRAQWAAHLISSEALGGGLPGTVAGVAALSGYLGLIERGSRVAEQAIA